MNLLAFQIVRHLFLFVFSFLLAMIFAPYLIQLLSRHHLGKQIRQDQETPIFTNLHKKKEGTPTMGGILIWGSTFLMTYLFYLLSIVGNGFFSRINFLSRSETWLPLGAMMGAALVGLLDDFLGVLRIGPKGGGLRMREKILVYILIALIGAWWFYVKLERTIIHVPFLGDYNLGIFYPLFFIFILVASAFSMNETDGLDGLAGGISVMGFACLLIVSFVEGYFNLSSFLAVLIGAIIAFLWFNVYPAKFFMGDTGAMALGITMGVVAMLTDTALLLPCFGFILMIESLSVIVQKIYKKVRKKKLFLSTPLHHHFEAKNWPETLITMRFWIVQGLASAIGLAFYFLDKFML
ncbi:MAG TPA: phospho-N-acetylmuramoyl-pentapeptide-transferase [Candidatus Paceibacterota bacterium]|jgi:phospho-N-acetylmuramoyl-pentapeptide-transferase|nr:phospho-N-acetylmuramoyl-pentapeptide-transferase [Candidatus Paceibacterota bacterium]HPQ22842.1 phospho-N-acetylmuramoyl-pentapeptide-transferase [Candidatus Paceibacterota bacterium]HRR45629.1 phospho-N-acetylmuramoyl-pentapeptide-transferase [Candidatus Paceibacterota bacterium]